MSWLDALFSSYKTIQIAGVSLPQRNVLNFAANATIVDNPSQLRTDVTPAGSALTNSQWVPVVDLDLTSLPTQTLGSDTTFTVGTDLAGNSLTWTKFNSAHDATPMAITNGTGLVIKPDQNADINPAAGLFSPKLFLPLSSIAACANADWSSRIRVYGYVASFNGAASSDNAILSIEDGENIAPNAYVLERGYQAASTQAFNARQFSGNNAFNQQANITIASTNNVMVVEAKLLDNNVWPYFGAFSSGWPSIANLTLINPSPTYTAGGRYIQQPTNNFLAKGPLQMGIALGAKRAGSSTSLNVTWGRVRVDIRL